MKKKLLALIVFFAFVSSLSFANGLNLNSLGSRALTMGGAFVGLADDFSAVYWNPAGIAFFKQKTFGFYGTDALPSSTYSVDKSCPPCTGFICPFCRAETLVDNAKTVQKNYISGMAAYYQPITKNIVAGLGVYVPSGLGAEWKGEDLILLHKPRPFGPDPDPLNWSSKIFMISISPVIAYKVNEQLAIGATFNLNYASMDMNLHAGVAMGRQSPTGGWNKPYDLGQYEESMTGWGIGTTLGVLYKPDPMISIGVTWRSPSKIKFKGTTVIERFDEYVNIGLPAGTIPTTADSERELTWPMWLAAGVALKPVENLTMTADVQFTQWEKIDKFKTTYTDAAGLWGTILGAAGKDIREFRWKNATQIRFGIEYLQGPVAFRAGYYYDPSPAPDQTMNILLPSYDFNVFTVGLGYNVSGVQIDLGFEYLAGKNRSIDFEVVTPGFDKSDPDYVHAMPGSYKMNVMVPNISISYKF